MTVVKKAIQEEDKADKKAVASERTSTRTLKKPTLLRGDKTATKTGVVKASSEGTGTGKSAVRALGVKNLKTSTKIGLGNKTGSGTRTGVRKVGGGLQVSEEFLANYDECEIIPQGVGANNESGPSETASENDTGDLSELGEILKNSGDVYPQLFGNYYVLDHLIDGGMAKICRARYLGEEAEKIVAIKMVQEKFSKDPEFKQMFIDEIKVSFGLQHPNIGSTYDYGMIKDKLFVSMEYIHGKNLKQFVDKLNEKKKKFPVDASIYIISKVCEALGYAHNFTNALTGEKYNIVHRDISPHNVMMTYEGHVKLIDFGIAKAATNSESTQDGAIKGKVSYIAPEYLDGKQIDGRYDQFAVGLTLWEMLVGKRTFKGENDLDTLRQIMACNVERPSLHNKLVPKELDDIVMKSLSKDPKDRYPNMEAMSRELIKLLYNKYPDFHESDLAPYAQDLFKEDFEKERKAFLEYGKVDISIIVKQMNLAKEKREKAKNGETTGTSSSKGPNQRIMLELDFDDVHSLLDSGGDQGFANEIAPGGNTGRITGVRKNHQALLMQQLDGRKGSAKSKARAKKIQPRERVEEETVEKKSNSSTLIIILVLVAALGYGYNEGMLDQYIEPIFPGFVKNERHFEEALPVTDTAPKKEVQERDKFVDSFIQRQKSKEEVAPVVEETVEEVAEPIQEVDPEVRRIQEEMMKQRESIQE